MQSLSLKQMLGILWLRRGVVAAMVTLCLGASVTYTLVRPTEYTSEIAFYVSAQGVETATSAYQGSLLSEQRVQSYADLATTPRITRELIRSLQLRRTEAELAADIRASAAPDTVILSASVSATSPEEAARIANRFGEVLPAVVASLERPQVPGTPVPVVLRAIDSATLPTERSNSGPVINIGLGLLVGLALGVAVAFVRHSLDTSVRSGSQLSGSGAGPLLGEIARSNGAHNLDLSEGFRRVRTNLRYVAVDSPCRAIVVTSAVAGEGKTSTCLGLARSLSDAGHQVLVVDADLRRPTVAGRVGVQPEVGLTSILTQNVVEGEALQKSSDNAFGVLASGGCPPNPAELLASQQMRNLIVRLRAHFDYVLIDSSPLVPVADTLAILPYVDGALMVGRYGSTKGSEIDEAVAAVSKVGGRLIGCVLNMAPVGGSSYYGPSSYQSLETESGGGRRREAERPRDLTRKDSEATTTTLRPSSRSRKVDDR